MCVFFFQAEDGIRDRLVTGVQTCALPILLTNYSINNLKLYRVTNIHPNLLDAGSNSTPEVILGSEFPKSCWLN